MYGYMDGILLLIFFFFFFAGRWGEEGAGCGAEREVDKLLNSVSSGSL